MDKHTPGPWFAKPDPHAMTRDDWVVGIEGGPIDEVAVCSKRDANLIAAAPDLLDALRRVMRHIPDDAGGCSLSDDMHRAHAAIKRATKR
jgi:hypothetical protein